MLPRTRLGDGDGAPKRLGNGLGPDTLLDEREESGVGRILSEGERNYTLGHYRDCAVLTVLVSKGIGTRGGNEKRAPSGTRSPLL